MCPTWSQHAHDFVIDQTSFREAVNVLNMSANRVFCTMDQTSVREAFNVGKHISQDVRADLPRLLARFFRLGLDFVLFVDSWNELFVFPLRWKSECT